MHVILALFFGLIKEKLPCVFLKKSRKNDFFIANEECFFDKKI
ncbi:hypothetical protein D104_05450 [Marinomonas profundimaris]|uniref:Uncharacterized protein n=1 Tax=Marinomonas profundimaris TaxID=1208321 RepID=W1RW24_9GAMM|nr:hypothetical protein D104_05450 [Marinomonas profundimaris]